MSCICPAIWVPYFPSSKYIISNFVRLLGSSAVIVIRLLRRIYKSLLKLELQLSYSVAWYGVHLFGCLVTLDIHKFIYKYWVLTSAPSDISKNKLLVIFSQPLFVTNWIVSLQKHPTTNPHHQDAKGNIIWTFLWERVCNPCLLIEI